MHVRIDWNGGWSRVALAVSIVLFFEARAKAAEEQRADTTSAETRERPQPERAAPPSEISDIMAALHARADAIALFANESTLRQGELELEATSSRLGATSARLLEDASQPR